MLCKPSPKILFLAFRGARLALLSVSQQKVRARSPLVNHFSLITSPRHVQRAKCGRLDPETFSKLSHKGSCGYCEVSHPVLSLPSCPPAQIQILFPLGILPGLGHSGCPWAETPWLECSQSRAPPQTLCAGWEQSCNRG